MAKKKIHFGVIGCSRIANSSTIPAIINSKFSDLEVLGSRNAKKSKEFAEKFKCKNYGTYEEVIENDKVDAVYISTPVGLHEKWVLNAIKNGKHVLCEKSIGDSFSSVKKMVNYALKNKIRLMEGLMFRFHPSHKKVQDLINKKTFGDIFSFYGEYGFPKIPKTDIRYSKKLGGGIINDAACYPIYASRMIFGEEPTQVFCVNQIVPKKNIDERTSMSLVFEKNKVAQMKCGYNLNYANFYSIWGEKGAINLIRSYNIPPKMRANISINTEKFQKCLKIKPVDHFELMFNHFSNEIIKKAENKFDFEEDILKQGKVMEAVRISSKKKQIIEISSIK